MDAFKDFPLISGSCFPEHPISMDRDLDRVPFGRWTNIYKFLLEKKQKNKVGLGQGVDMYQTRSNDGQRTSWIMVY